MVIDDIKWAAEHGPIFVLAVAAFGVLARYWHNSEQRWIKLDEENRKLLASLAEAQSRLAEALGVLGERISAMSVKIDAINGKRR